MYKFLLGILFTISLTSVANYHWTTNGHYEHLAFSFMSQIIQGNYIIDPLTGRCSTTTLYGNGVIGSKYFNCDAFQVYINREE